IAPQGDSLPTSTVEGVVHAAGAGEAGDGELADAARNGVAGQDDVAAVLDRDALGVIVAAEIDDLAAVDAEGEIEGATAGEAGHLEVGVGAGIASQDDFAVGLDRDGVGDGVGTESNG